MTRKHFLALATLTLLVAAFLRIWQLAIYPPGPHYDEAAELLIARSIAFGGARFFPMVEAYQGREVLYYYLSVPLLTLVNDGMFSLRVLSVFCNLITIAASVALGRSMFRGRQGAVVGLAIGVLMTLSFPMIWMSRQAFRSSTLPLMQALALLFLWKGLREKRARNSLFLLVIGGLFAGGAVYTYNSSRLFPFWLLIGGAALLWFDRKNWHRRLGQGAIFFVTLAITAAPMAVYAIQRPDVFWGRLSEVTEADKSVTLAQSIVLHGKMFFIAGDPYFRYNVAGRPYFTWPEGILLLIGIGVAFWRLVGRKRATNGALSGHTGWRSEATARAAYVLALISPLMVIPSVISVGGLPPSNTRSLGMVPLIFVLVAIGADWCISKLEGIIEGRHMGLPLQEQDRADDRVPLQTDVEGNRAHDRAPLAEQQGRSEIRARHASPLQDDAVDEAGGHVGLPLQEQDRAHDHVPLQTDVEGNRAHDHAPLAKQQGRSEIRARHASPLQDEAVDEAGRHVDLPLQEEDRARYIVPLREPSSELGTRAKHGSPLQGYPVGEWANHASPLQSDLVRYIVPLLVVVTLIVGGGLVWDVYYRWASDPALFYEADADISLAAKWLVAQQVDHDTPVYLAARDKGHPTVMIEPVPPITWLGTDSLFRPAPGVTGLYIFPRSAPPPEDWAAWLAPGAISDLPLGPDGRTAFQAFHVAGDAPLPVEAATVSAHNQTLTFVGLDTAQIAAGSSGTISMAWQIDRPPTESDFTPLLMLEDGQGNLITRSDAYMAGTNEWRAGETLIQRMAVQVPAATPPGEYALKIAWVGRASNTYAPYISENGDTGATWAEIGSLTVTRPTTFPDPTTIPMDVRQPSEIAPGVTLLGWDTPPTSLRPGEVLPITLYWQAREQATRPALTLQALLHSEQGDTVLWTGQPIADSYTSEQWADGEVLADRERWIIPREQAAGDYNLEIGLNGKMVTVGVITVSGVPRLFEAPPVEQVLSANFGDKVLLYGDTIETNSSGVSLEIVWKALDNIPTNYKVFVHLVDRNGAILAQRDAMPQSNGYPTSLWLPGEFVVDSYELPLLETGTALRLGLYSPDDGTRLAVFDAEHKVIGDSIQIDF